MNPKKQKDIALSADSNDTLVALASGLSDDFNNILTVIFNACSLVESGRNNDPDLLRCLALIRTSAEHAAVLSKKLSHEYLADNPACLSAGFRKQKQSLTHTEGESDQKVAQT